VRAASLARSGWLACAAAACTIALAQPPGNGWDGALRASQAAVGRSLAGGTDQLVLRDTLNRPVRLADYRGKPLVVSFIYTGCFQSCPITTQRLAEGVRAAREALGDDSFQVVSIGFNQPFDDVPAMAAFARQMRVRDRHWAFLAPAAADVAQLTHAFGFGFQATPKGFDHVTQLTIVDSGGRIAAQVYGENFELPMFVGPLKDLLAGQAARGTDLQSVWRKVKLYCTVYDPVSGGYRLNYSLFFEIFCGVSVLAALGAFMARELRRAMKPPRSQRSPPAEGAPAAGRRSWIRERPWLGRLMRRCLRGMEH
jgi:protein SCO1